MDCLHSAKVQTQNQLFGLRPTSRCLYTQASLLCAVHTLSPRLRDKVTYLVFNRTGPSSKKRDQITRKKLFRRLLCRETIMTELHSTEFSTFHVRFSCKTLSKLVPKAQPVLTCRSSVENIWSLCFLCGLPFDCLDKAFVAVA